MITPRDRQNFYNGALVGTVLTTFIFIIFTSVTLERPDVHVSWDTKQCVKVINYGDAEYTCDNLPTRYNHIWVR
jgi:hypothetical protein